MLTAPPVLYHIYTNTTRSFYFSSHFFELNLLCKTWIFVKSVVYIQKEFAIKSIVAWMG